ncbi:hypothetical protein Golax_005051 [Gossypium laxum]|uniref:Uncharacterized protein n=1 Tax=Gossypium laxum TaxID=34288 RepID=A0A7J9A0W9_9ROSI|nr:hypothetical protein [Gossypium laxum]
MNVAESLSNDRIGEGEDFTTDCNTKKVRFKDGSDDSLENMVVDSSPISEFSWKDKLLVGSISNSLNGAANLNLEFEDGDIHRSNLNGIHAIDFLDRINKILIKGMELTVVVKLLRRNIGFGALYNHITSLWKPTQSFRLMDCLGLDPLPGSAEILVPEEDLREDWKSEGHGGEGIPKSSLSSETASAKKGDALLMVGEAFSPWMVVERKSWCKKEGIRGQKTKILEGNLVGSKFEMLSSMDSESLTSNLEMPSKGLGAARFIQGDFIKNLKGKRIEKGSGLVAMVNLSEGLLGQVGDMVSENSRPHSALGLPQKCTGSSLEHFGSQQVMGQINNSYSLGLEGVADCSLNSMVVGDGSWKLDLFRPWVPEEIINKIIGVPPPHPSSGPDQIIWELPPLALSLSKVLMRRCNRFAMSLWDYHVAYLEESKPTHFPRFDEGFVVDGGCLRDHNGEWIIRRFEKILIQTNSIEAINVILEDSSGNSNSALVRKIHLILRKMEQWKI